MSNSYYYMAMDTSDRGVLRRLGKYFRPHQKALIIALGGAIFVGAANSALAPVVKILMDLFSGVSQALMNHSPLQVSISQKLGGVEFYNFTIDSFNQARRALLGLIAAALALIVIKGLVHFGKEYLLWKVTHQVLMRLKHELFERIAHLPQSTFDRQKSGDMLSRVTYDVTQVENAVRSSINLAKALIYALIYLAMLFYMEWSLTLVALTVVPLSGLLIKLFGDRVRRLSRKVSLNVADYTSHLSEAISGAKIIKAFGRENVAQAEFDHKIRDNYRFNLKISRLNALHAPAQEVFATIGLIIVIAFCFYRLLSGHMTLGDLSGFLLLLNFVYKPIKDLGEANAVIQRAIASSRRIFNLLDEPDENVVVPSGSLKPTPVKGNLEFKEVWFEYEKDVPALRGVNLKIESGETVAMVGPSGGGKSTLVSLIPRFYNITQGSLCLDGIDLRQWDREYLRRQIAIVPQETILFSGSIESNIRLGNPEALPEQVVQAAQAAYAHGFIEKLTDGYNTEVGERGVTLSGGQRQRLAIARAILRNPRVLLLDEATSSLDTESERLIQDALEKFRRNRTTLVIAHRLSTIQSADRIAVVVEGRIVELGNHRNLYDAGGVYRSLCDQQFIQITN